MKLTIGNKLFTGFGVMLVLIGIVGAVGWQSTTALSSRSDDLFRKSVRDTVHLAQAEDALWRLVLDCVKLRLAIRMIETVFEQARRARMIERRTGPKDAILLFDLLPCDSVVIGDTSA